MVKKQSNPLDDPPTASSSASEDDEVQTSEEGEEEEVSSSEEEESSDPVKAPSAAVTIAVPGKSTAAAAAKQDESDSESGSETETDSDSETERPSNPASGKAAAVTTVVTAKPPKQKEAQSSAALALPAAKSGTKRPSEGTSKDTKAKRAKKVTDDEKKTGEDTKKPAFQRLWSEEDEIAVLQGMIDFKSDTGKSFSEDTNRFYDFIKKSISFDVSKNQFMDKIRSLKKKYMGKEKNGVEPSFTKPHDQKSFELSKVIWGPEGIALESTIKANGASNKSRSKSTKKKLDELKQELFTSSPNGKKVEEDNTKKVVVHGGGDVELVKESDWFENSFIARSISGFGLDEHSVKQRWTLVPKESKKRIEEKLKALQAKEIEFVLQKTEFLHQVTSLIAEASKNKSN